MVAATGSETIPFANYIIERIKQIGSTKVSLHLALRSDGKKRDGFMSHALS